ncbi:DinB family protein [Paenibacillus albicereus]|uniref:DinB family protein n=1 Tax=Paenibacillus albicereus TaxID=2726185 RepID=A0A6H2GYW8_9BACL|nr:DinB family protein [Paenibacillus albicereus]QJC52633.1 DinB family protein [Paenibacillus albicereus]
MDQAIVHTSQVVRQIVLGQVQAAAEEQMDRQPEGFANTIRWNIGHIVYWRDRYATLCFGVPSAIPGHYAALFDSGTKPADWTEAPPTKAELLEHLAAQLGRLSEIAPEKWEAELKPPLEMWPFSFHTSAELFNFALVHEGIHLGVVMSLLRATRTSGERLP